MSLGKTKEFYNLLRAQFIKEISEDHEISKILSSDTIDRLDKLWQTKLEASGCYHPHPSEQLRGAYNMNIQPNTFPNLYNTGRPTMISQPAMNVRLQEFRPQPLLKNPIPQKDIQEKIEEHIEVKQEYKNDTEHITNTNEATKKTVIIEPIKVKKPSKHDESEEEEHKKGDSDGEASQKGEENPDDEDLFRDTGEPTEQVQPQVEENDDKRKAPPIEEYSPLGSSDSIEDHDNIETTDMIVGYHEKVHRHGTKWKVNLKHCIMNLKGREYILSTVTGEFDF